MRLLVLLFLVFATKGQETEFNDHFYSLNSTGASKLNARSSAQSETRGNFRGYLATITSRGEFDHLNEKFGQTWISGARSTSLNYGSTSQAYAYFPNNDTLIPLSSAGNVWRFEGGPEEGFIYHDGENCLLDECFWRTGQPDSFNSMGLYRHTSDPGWSGYSHHNGYEYYIEYGGGVCVPSFTGINCDKGLLQLDGSFYDVWKGSLTTSEAKTMAESRTFRGFKGRLASVNSKRERDFLSNYIRTTFPSGDHFPIFHLGGGKDGNQWIWDNSPSTIFYESGSCNGECFWDEISNPSSGSRLGMFPNGNWTSVANNFVLSGAIIEFSPDDCIPGKEGPACADFSGYFISLYESNTFIEIPHHSDLTMTGRSFTIECFVNTHNANDNMFFGTLLPIISKRNSKGFEYALFARPDETSVGLVQFVFRVEGTEVSTGLFGRSIYHVAVTLSNNAMTIYVNGEPHGNAFVQEGITSSSSPVLLGISSVPSDILPYQSESLETFQGGIDELRFWKTARSANQIKDNYIQRVDPNESDLVAYFRFDEGFGKTAHDITSGLIGRLRGTESLPKWERAFTPIEPVLIPVDGTAVNGSLTNSTSISFSIDFDGSPDDLSFFFGDEEVNVTEITSSTFSFLAPSLFEMTGNGTSLRRRYMGVTVVDNSEWENDFPPILGFPCVIYPPFCPENYFLPFEGSEECQPCPEGTYSDTVGTVGSCTIIPTTGSLSHIENPETDTTELYIIIGSTVGAALILLVLLIVALVLLRRRRQRTLKLIPPNYSRLAFPLLNPKYETSKDSTNVLEELEKVLTRPKFELVHWVSDLAQPTDYDELSRNVSYIFLANDHSLFVDLLCSLIRKEVESSQAENTLFRANSQATRVFHVYSKIFALQYLWKTLALPVNELNEKALQESKNTFQAKDIEDQESILKGTIEMDPMRLGGEGEVDVDYLAANSYTLLATLTSMFSRIKRSMSTLPPTLRVILRCVKEEVEKKFGDGMSYKAIGSFYFLRLVIPAITSPHIYGLLKDPPAEQSQRLLILISKILQNLANEVRPSTRDPFMQKLDSFVIENLEALHVFYDLVVDISDNVDYPEIEVPKVCQTNALAWFHNTILSFKKRDSPPEEVTLAESPIPALK